MDIKKENILEIKNLSVNFYLYKKCVKAVQNLNLTVQKGEIFGLVGETGSGKSVTALSILRLISMPPGKIESGEILFKGSNLLKKNKTEMHRIRGKDISIIFQDPMTTLNPVFTIGDQIKTIIRVHQKVSKNEAVKKAMEVFRMVGLSDPAEILKKYPNELSGGMNQRVMIAMALSCNPSLLIADEPTTALDVTIQMQILHLIKNLRKKIDTSIILITHDLGIVSKMCEKVAVLYAGRIVEIGEVRSVFKNPKHPYTRGLLEAIPKLTISKKKLKAIQGSVPDMSKPFQGCMFSQRCPFVKEICRLENPKQIEFEKGHFVSCHLFC